MTATEYEQAFRALCENSIEEYAARVTEETPGFLRANRAVHEAERGVSWWRRWLIDRRVLRELDYWKRMCNCADCAEERELDYQERMGGSR